jgi:hypothetical protein
VRIRIPDLDFAREKAPAVMGARQQIRIRFRPGSDSEENA